MGQHRKLARLACLVSGVLYLAISIHALAADWRLTYGQTPADYQASAQTLTNQGFRPICLDVDGMGAASSYTTVWLKDGFTDWLAETNLTADQFTEMITNRTAEGYRVLCLDSYGIYPQERYAAVWVKDPRASDFLVEIRDLNWSNFNTRFKEGYGAAWFDVNAGSSRRFSTVYSKQVTYTYYYILSNPDSILQKSEEISCASRPVVVRKFSTLYAAIWADLNWVSCQDARIEFNQTADEFARTIEKYSADGCEPVSVTQYGGIFQSVWKRPLAPLLPNRIACMEMAERTNALLRIENETPEDLQRYMELIPVQTSTNLIDWEPLATFEKTATNNSYFVGDTESNGNMRFYRTPASRFITPLLQPSGPFRVGEFSQLVTDPARYDESRQTNWQFMVTCWYPTSSPGGQPPESYVDGILVNYLQCLLPHSRMSAFYSHALAQAPFATNLPACPVVIYSSQVGSHRRENLMFVEELASHGFVVVGLDHRDSLAAVFPDGCLVQGKLAPTAEEGSVQRLADTRLVLDLVEQWQRGDSLLAGHLDLDRIGAFGFIFGGTMAVELALKDQRCKAVANLDGAFINPELASSGCPKPLLMIRSDTSDPAFDGDNRLPVFQLSKAAAYWIKFAGASVQHFYEQGFLLRPEVLNAYYSTQIPTNGYRVQDLVRTALVSFFKRHLKGEEDGELDKFLDYSLPDIAMAIELNYR